MLDGSNLVGKVQSEQKLFLTGKQSISVTKNVLFNRYFPNINTNTSKNKDSSQLLQCELEANPGHRSNTTTKPAALGLQKII